MIYWWQVAIGVVLAGVYTRFVYWRMERRLAPLRLAVEETKARYHLATGKDRFDRLKEYGDAVRAFGKACDEPWWKK